MYLVLSEPLGPFGYLARVKNRVPDWIGFQATQIFKYSYSSTMEHLAITAIILEEPQNRKRQRRWSVHPLWKNRSQQGEFQIYNTLIDHVDKFYNYFKMSRNTFNALLDRIELLRSRNDTNWKRSISPRERLAICLR